MNKINIGFAMTGSFCTFAKALEQAEKLAEDEKWNIYPILSENSYTMDSRFGTARSTIEKLEALSGKEVIHRIVDAEPIGPKKLLDVLVVAPCTSNTLAKIANGVNDTPVTMAVKSHIRNERPVVLAVSTNDALAAAGRNIGQLMGQRNIFFVPMAQDDPKGKPRSVVADFGQLIPAVEAALEGRQIQPILL